MNGVELPPDFPDFTSSKMVDDCYEFLHLVEVGHGSMKELIAALGSANNRDDSNHRQIERIKLRCIKAGIDIRFDPIQRKFQAPAGSKFTLLQSVEESLYRNNTPLKFSSFGPYQAAKIARPC